jgi:hypothetical protein
MVLEYLLQNKGESFYKLLVIIVAILSLAKFVTNAASLLRFVFLQKRKMTVRKMSKVQ